LNLFKLISNKKNYCYYYFRHSIDFKNYFDQKYYLEENPDIQQAGINPLKHYLISGGYEGRRPCADFDSKYYLSKNKDVLESGLNPLIHYLQYGKKEGRFINYNEEKESDLLNEKSYLNWIREYDTFTELDLSIMKNSIDDFSIKPLISIIMPVYNPNIKWLIEAIESVCNQIYNNWELCIADDCSTDPGIHPVLSEFQQKDPRIKVVFRTSNGHISAASNSALELATGDYITLLDQDDLLPVYALYFVSETINLHPDLKLIYGALPI